MPAADMIVLWRVFEHCNLGCSFCAYSKYQKRSRMTADIDHVLSFGAVLGDYSRTRGRRVHVSWMGGEPLLWPKLPMLARTFRNEFGLRLGVTSNGLPLESKAVRASLIDDYEELTISLDGVGQFHDWCRNSPGLFDRVRCHVKILQSEAAASRPMIRVNTILMRGNIDHFEQLCREVASWGVRELTFNQLGGNDRPEFYPANRLLPEQVDRFADELPRARERMALLGLTIRGSTRYIERLVSTARDIPIPIHDCDPGRSFLFIDEQERIAPCSFTASHYGVPMAEITSLAQLEQLPELFARRRKIAAPSCNDCHSTQVFDKFIVPGSRKGLQMVAMNSL